MRPGQKVGGKVATPVREMLSSELYNGVIFECNDGRAAERTRTAALVLRGRNQYDYHTRRRGNKLIVYKGEDIDEPNYFTVDHRD